MIVVRRITRALCMSATALCLASSSVWGQTKPACTVYPADHVWNTAIDHLPVHPQSATFITTIGASRTFHADFGSGLWDGGPIGIPFITVPGTQPKLPATFAYADESDKGPYAIPLNAPIEGGPNASGDRHAISIDTDNCILYELYDARPQAASWKAGSGAIYDLKSYALRPKGWTSADAAGLPILPGLVRYDEVLSGEIRHAIRFTAPQTRNQFVWPARHKASSLSGTQYPPMGQRFRLKASFNEASYSPQVQVILRAMKKYGIILADNGSAWYVSGAPDARWNNDLLRQLHRVYGSDFEAVDGTTLMITENSGQARQTAQRVTVTPPTAKVFFNATLQMKATTENLSSNQVMWSTTAGRIDQLGLFTAPTTAGTVTITAASVANPDVKATATITVQKRTTR